MRENKIAENRVESSVVLLLLCPIHRRPGVRQMKGNLGISFCALLPGGCLPGV